jgi:hypothetical protein
MKTVYITESMAKLLKESVLADALPSDIMAGVKETPYENTPMFMGGSVMTDKFMSRALASQFESAKNALKNIGQIDSVNAKTVEDAFQKIILKCQKIEETNRSALEKLAANYVINLFSIPDDTLTIETKLVNKIEGADDISPVEPFDGDVDFETADLDDLSSIDAEVAKRYFLNALNMGAGMSISENIRGYIEDLYDIDSRLPQLYKEALALNNYMIFKSSDLGISDEDRKQVGVVNVKLTPSDELVVISAQGVIFPILLCELIRGLMELFSSHGLPKDRARREYIIKKADYLKAEPWQMRIGPYMWKIFTEYFEGSDTSEMPYIYQTLAKLKPATFFKVISEMMAKTKKGKAYAEKIMNKALNKKEEASFKDKMQTYSKNKSVITDEYMSREEF